MQIREPPPCAYWKKIGSFSNGVLDYCSLRCRLLCEPEAVGPRRGEDSASLPGHPYGIHKRGWF